MKNWAVYILAALGFFAYGAYTNVDRDSSGTIVGEGNVGVFDVHVGDCFDDASESTSEVSNLPGVPCSAPHDNEAYAVFDLTIDSYPEGDGMSEMANSSCLDKFEDYVGIDYQSSSLELYAVYPSSQSWAQDDREVICAMYDMNGEKLVGSKKGSGI